MDYEQFLEQVKADLQEQFPYMNVEIRSVEKLQGQSYTGISITPEGSNAGATMNLHSQYEMLQDGVPMDIVMRHLHESKESQLTPWSRSRRWIRWLCRITSR